MGICSRRMKNRSLTREELRAQTLHPARFEMLEPRLMLDGLPTANFDSFFNDPRFTENCAEVFIPAEEFLANDTHEDPNETLTIVGVTQPASSTVDPKNHICGTARVGEQGGIAGIFYQPDPGVTGFTTFFYTIEDSAENTDDAQIIINVNANPVAVDDTVYVNTALTQSIFHPLVNDSDDGGTFTLTAVTQGAQGSVEIGDDGQTILYTPDEGVATYDDTFTYTITDNLGATATATVTVAEGFAAANDAPVVIEDSAENVLDVLGNDAAEATTITSTTNPTYGTLVNEGTQLKYTPMADFYGEETFTYTVENAEGKSVTATVTVTVENVNDDPIAEDDLYGIAPGERSVTIYALMNDYTYPDYEETLTADSFTTPAEGTVIWDNEGEFFVYTLNEGVTFSGRDSFEYTVSDGNGGTATATVTVGSLPDPGDDSYTFVEDTIPEGTLLDVLVNDTDTPAGSTVMIYNVEEPAHGTVIEGGDNEFGREQILYTPDPDFQGVDTFQYYVIDDDGLINTAVVTITITNTYDPPEAEDDVIDIDYTTGGTTLDVLANDNLIEPEFPTIQPGSFPAETDEGTLAVQTDSETGYQTFLFTPGTAFTGEYTFSYTIEDSVGATSTAGATVRMKPQAEADTATATEDGPAIDIDVLANDDFHALNGSLTITKVTQGHGGSVTISATGDYITYQPHADFHGTDTFTYTIQDEAGYTVRGDVTVTVTDVNDAPVVAQSFASLEVHATDAPTVIDVIPNFRDNDSLLIYHFTTNMGEFDLLLYEHATPITVANFRQYADSGAYVDSFIHRSVPDFVVQGGGYTYDEITGPVEGPVAIPEFDPILNEFGVSNLRGTIAMAKLGGDPNSATSQWFFNVVDNSGNLDNQNEGFTVFGEVLGDGMAIIDAINDLPIGFFDSPYDQMPLQNYDGESVPTTDNLVMIQSVLDTGGTVPLTYSVVSSNPEIVTAVVDENGQLQLEYNPNSGGDAQITVRATDEFGAFAETTFDVHVIHTLEANDDQYTVKEDSVDNVLDVLTNDNDLPEHLPLTIDSAEAEHGTVVNNGTTLLYTPDADFAGEDTLTYTVRNANDMLDTAAATITVENDNNDPPAAVDDALDIDYTTGGTELDVLANDFDVDPGDTLTIRDPGFPLNTGKGTVELNQAGDKILYTPGENFDGEDTFTYTIFDTNNVEATATVTLRMKPGAVNDAITVNENSAANTIDVLGNDNWHAANGVVAIDPVTGFTQGLHGLVALVGDPGSQTLTYLPDADYYGEDEFTYTIQDVNGLESTAAVTVNVNAQPEAADDSAVMDYGQPVEIDVLANDTDPTPNDTLAVLDTGYPLDTGEGEVALVTDPDTGYQTLVYTPGVNFDGEDTFTYTIVDSNLAESTATVTVRMKPGAVDDEFTMDEDSGVTTLDVLAQGTDLNSNPGGSLEIVGISPLSNLSGSLILVTPGDGETFAPYITYQPNPNFHGTDTFTYTIENELGLQDTAAVTITVENVNDAPNTELPFAYLNLGVNPAPTVIDLAPYFWDVDSQNRVYRFTTNMGTFDVRMYEFQTPITVENFRQYVNSGAYVNSFIHRSVSNFVVQGGGYTFTDENGFPEEIPTNDPIQNEPYFSNLPGTIAMAKVGGDPDSATSQWFFNLADNSQNLDNQNGGFTVFGEVLGDGMDVIDDMAAVETYNFGSPYDSIPLQNYVNGGSITEDNFVMFHSIELLACDVPLIYTAVSSKPGLVTASVDAAGQLILQYNPNVGGGPATITIRATDASGAFVESTLDLYVNNRPDLVVRFGKVTMPAQPLPNDNCFVQVIVTNIEPFQANGYMDIEIWATKDGDVLNYDPLDDVLLTTLTNQRVNLGLNRSAAYTARFTMPGGMDPGKYKLMAVVDSGDAIAERHETNNTAVYDAQTYGVYSEYADLTGYISRVWYRNNAMAAGDSGYAMVDVRNDGNQTAAGTMNISLYLCESVDPDPEKDINIGELINTRVNLKPEKTKTYRVNFTIGDGVPVGAYWVYAKIDSIVSQIDESCQNLVDLYGINPEENNDAHSGYYNFVIQNYQTQYHTPQKDTGCYDVLVERPDLRARVYQTRLSAAPLAGERAWARVLVSNYGWVRARGRVNVQLFLRPKGTTGDQDILLGARDNFAVNLRPYYSKPVLIPFRLPYTLAEGEYELVASVTPASAGLLESDATNNQAAYGSYQVREAFVNLTTSIVRRIIKRDPSTEGDAGFIKVQITNEGNTTVRARGVVLNLWACSTANPDAAGATKYLLGTKTLNLGLRPDRWMRTNFQFRVPDLDALPAGNYYIIAVVDATDVVPEAVKGFDAESDNTTAKANYLKIGLPDLTGVIKNINLPTNVLAGTAGKAVITITNHGTVRANGRYDIKVYARKEGQDDIELGSVLNRRVVLWPKRTTSVTVNLDTDIPAGDYQIVAVIDDGKTIPESLEANNEAVAGALYSIQPVHRNLIGAPGTPVVANPAVGGAQIRVPLRITNDGNTAIRQRLDIDFFANVGGQRMPIGTLNDYFTVLAPGQTKTVWYTTNLPTGFTTPQSYHIEATLDARNDLLEWNPAGTAETDNEVVSNDTFVVNPAFVAFTGELQAPVVANPATVNDPLQATVRLVHTGTIHYNENVTVTFEARAGGVKVQDLGVKTVAVNLNPGQAINIAHTMPVPAGLAVGTYDVVAVVEAPNTTDVAVTNDNGQNALTIGQSNLTAGVVGTPIPDPAVELTTHSVDIQVNNTGDVRYQGPVDVQVWAVKDGNPDGQGGDFLLNTLTVPNADIAAGQSGTYTLNVTLPDDMNTAATYQLATVISSAPGLTGDDPADNQALAGGTFQVQDGSLDLTVTADWPLAPYGANHEVFIAGETHTMNVTVTNNGNVPVTSSFHTELYCDSWNHTVGTSDIALGGFDLDGLAPGESVTRTLTFRFPTSIASDNYNLAVITDTTNAVNEGTLGEGNNITLPYKTYYVVS
ncbi:MAG: tandem-95 repeat protein [Phycisphaerae bacterium]|nr:tandem-95 repeat protein [Phycisphaerae bacterium]